MLRAQSNLPHWIDHAAREKKRADVLVREHSENGVGV